MPLLKLRNPLVYPGGRPGFNPAHPAAAQRPVVSAVALPGGVGSLTTGKRFTVVGSPTYPIKGFGPTALVPASAQLTIAVSGTASTFAGIASIPAATASQYAIGTNGGSGPGLLFATSGTATFDFWNGSDNAIGGAPALNTPYFFAVSYSAATLNSVIVNLLNGELTSFTESQANAPQSYTTVYFGCDSSGTQPLLGNIAAGMISNTFLSLPQLKAWAQAPWDFWYPPTVRNLISLSLTTSASVAAASPLYRRLDTRLRR